MTFLLSGLTWLINYVRKHWRLVLYIAAGLALFFAIVFAFRSCGKPPKLDEDLIQKGEQAIKTGNDKELANTLIESDKREAEALAPSVNAKAEVTNKVSESTQKWNNANRDELQAEYDRRKNAGN